MNLGETVVVVWTNGGGQVLVEEVDNKSGEVACWLNGTTRLAVDAKCDWAHGMIHTRTRSCPG